MYAHATRQELLRYQFVRLPETVALSTLDTSGLRIGNPLPSASPDMPKDTFVVRIARISSAHTSQLEPLIPGEECKRSCNLFTLSNGEVRVLEVFLCAVARTLRHLASI